MKDKNGNVDCKGIQNCSNCVECYDSTWCDNSTGHGEEL